MENLLKKVYESKRLSLFLSLASHAVVVASALALIPLIHGAYLISQLTALLVLVILAVPFVVVSLVRKLIGAPRPYELYSFYEAPPKSKSGAAFPSRHAFSVFAIGTALCFIYPIIGATLLALGLFLCTARVLLGIHFVRDVTAGAVIGILSSVIGMLIIL